MEAYINEFGDKIVKDDRFSIYRVYLKSSNKEKVYRRLTSAVNYVSKKRNTKCDWQKQQNII